MDLSSLEGPPITDSRFSSPTPSTTNIPRIRLDNTFSPVSPLDSNHWNLPRRPASTDAIPPRNKYSNTESNGLWQNIHPNCSNNNNSSSSRTNFRTPPNQSLRPGLSRGPSHFTDTLSPAHRPSRSLSNGASTPHQLVWVESEQIWFLTTGATAPTSIPHQGLQPPRLNPGLTGGGASRLMDRFASTNYLEDTETDDLPPPYEQHVFDQPLGPIVQPVTRARPEEVPHRGSRWAAIGRRAS
ncbi:hypothetical protein BDW62DRAFT_199929 [Aspergillus aurantiobrunneus]